MSQLLGHLHGLTAGGVDLPAEVMGRFALAGITVHAWDLAMATDQDIDLEPILVRSGRDPGWRAVRPG